MNNSNPKLNVACYYFPNYHTGDPRNDTIHGKDWNEWRLVEGATPRFPGHQQPNIPLHGFQDEKQPAVMAQKIKDATDHGIKTFLFDWYYYDDGPFLNRALEEGFLKAENRNEMQFATMWANHTWTDIHPCGRFSPRTPLYDGKVKPETFEKVVQIHCEQYFPQQNYLKFNGCPYFSIYDLNQLLQSFGSIKETRRALDSFRTACKSAGFPDLHLNAVVFGFPILPGENVPCNLKDLIGELGFDSITSYVWVHHVSLSRNLTPYQEALAKYMEFWQDVRKEYQIEYYPNITAGWDASPRTIQTEVWDWDSRLWYPHGNMISQNTPEALQEAAELILQEMKKLSLSRNFVTLNSWNEWTEGSYLEPDQAYGYARLEAIRNAVRKWNS